MRNALHDSIQERQRATCEQLVTFSCDAIGQSREEAFLLNKTRPDMLEPKIGMVRGHESSQNRECWSYDIYQRLGRDDGHDLFDKECHAASQDEAKMKLAHLANKDDVEILVSIIKI